MHTWEILAKTPNLFKAKLIFFKIFYSTKIFFNIVKQNETPKQAPKKEVKGKKWHTKTKVFDAVSVDRWRTSADREGLQNTDACYISGRISLNLSQHINN